MVRIEGQEGGGGVVRKRSLLLYKSSTLGRAREPLVVVVLCNFDFDLL
jgi:hypothetical protein